MIPILAFIYKPARKIALLLLTYHITHITMFTRSHYYLNIEASINFLANVNLIQMYLYFWKLDKSKQL